MPEKSLHKLLKLLFHAYRNQAILNHQMIQLTITVFNSAYLKVTFQNFSLVFKQFQTKHLLIVLFF